MDRGFSLNHTYEVWDDSTGEKLVVCPDADGMDFVDIRSLHADGKIAGRITFDPKQGDLLVQALQKYLVALKA